MKSKLIFVLVVFFNMAHGQENNYSQKLAFPKQSFRDSSFYSNAIQKLSENIISIYQNNDKAAYLNDLFRLQFAQKDYTGAIHSLDSFAVLAIPEKAYRKVYGFHYRAYCIAMLQNTANNSFPESSTFTGEFNKLYHLIPDEAKDQLNNIYENADINKEKEKFIQLTQKFSSESDSISISQAIDYVKQWNYWQVYRHTVALALSQISIYKAEAKVIEEQKQLGLDEGISADPKSKTYIKNVTLVDVEKQKLLPNVTVEILGNKIYSIGTKTKIPANASVIDGSNQFLMPGLTDAHVHFFQSGGLYTRPDGLDFRKYMPYEKEIEWSHLNMKDVLKRNIINGITTVVDVGATYHLLELRDKYKGKSFAPDVYMTGPLLTTNEPSVFKNLDKDEPFSLVTNEEEGKKMVQQQLAYHPDFIKIWYILDEGADKELSARKYLPIIKAIIEESHKNNLKVAVHAMEKISAQLAVENGCDYLVHNINDEVITDSFIQLLKDKNILLCPTLSVGDNYAKTFGQLLDFTTYELKNANPIQLGSLYDLKHLPEKQIIENYKNAVRNGKVYYDLQDSINFVNLKKLSDAGVKIIAGTDAGNTGTMHGTSLLPELIKMKKSGMNNWQILQSATISPAYLFNKQNQSGSIAVGKWADMILLKSNPVDDLKNLQQITFVINKGVIIKPDTLIQETPLNLVQRQLNAYNARNIEAFMEPYADDVEMYQFPDKLLSKGKENMKKDYAFLNTLPDLHCEIKERIVQGNIIIDKESVTGTSTSKPAEATVIYHIADNKIKKVYFLQ